MKQKFSSDEIIKRIDGYYNNNIGILLCDIINYIQALTQRKRFDEADNMINFLLEKNIPEIKSKLARLLLYCFRTDEAINLINSNNSFSCYDYEILGQCYKNNGDLYKAKDFFNKAINQSKIDQVTFVCNRHLKEIENNELYGSFIEINYKYFIKNGNELEPGYVVSLRNNPVVLAGDSIYDPGLNLKHFIIWKIEDNDLYLIPITTSARPFSYGYTIYDKDYPNVGKDRRIKDSLCKTTKDNVISVVDKLREKDLKNTKYNLFLSFYFSKNQTDIMKDYMKEVQYEIELYNIIDIINPHTKERKSFFIESIEDDYYMVYEIDFFENKVLSFEPIKYPKDIVFFKSHVLKTERVLFILDQIENKCSKSLKKNK